MVTSRIFGGCRILMAAAKTASAKTTTVKTVQSGIMRPARVSPQLGKFLEASEASRTEAVKKIWQYIKLHNLQNPANKREIRCDETLKTILGKDKVGMLEISKLLSPHFIKSG